MRIVRVTIRAIRRHRRPVNRIEPNPAAVLPPLPQAGQETTPAQRRTVVAAIVALHAAGAWLALQVPAVRTTIAAHTPLFVNLIAPEAPPAPPPPAPPPPPQPRLQKKPPPPTPFVTAAPAPAPNFAVPEPPEQPVSPEPGPVVVQAPPDPPAPPAPPAPKEIPASAIEYLLAPMPEYPRLSRRLREAGTVIVRVFVDEAGVPRTVQIAQSSGFKRLDEAAAGAVLKARFKPYTEAGRPTAGWARIPFPFELESS